MNALDDFRRQLQRAGVALPMPKKPGRRSSPPATVRASEAPAVAPVAASSVEARPARSAGPTERRPAARESTAGEGVRLLPLQEAARLSGLSPAELRKLAEKGAIRGFRAPRTMGSHILLREDDLSAVARP